MCSSSPCCVVWKLFSGPLTCTFVSIALIMRPFSKELDHENKYKWLLHLRSKLIDTYFSTQLHVSIYCVSCFSVRFILNQTRQSLAFAITSQYIRSYDNTVNLQLIKYPFLREGGRIFFSHASPKAFLVSRFLVTNISYHSLISPYALES